MAELAAERRLIIILDEFPYLVEADPELPTLLQREWDLRLQHTQIFLVLSGSIQSVIQQQVWKRPHRFIAGIPGPSS